MTRLFIAPIMLAFVLAGCAPAQSPDVTNGVRSALDARGLRDVSVSQDRTAGVVTLSGTVASETDKAAAAAAAQSVAGEQVVANEIMVTPPGIEGDAEAIHDALDQGIHSNLEALMIRMGSPDDVDYSVESAVVTLTGSVTSPAVREELEKSAAEVPNVKQVVNQLQVEEQKATTTRQE